MRLLQSVVAAAFGLFVACAVATAGDGEEQAFVATVPAEGRESAEAEIAEFIGELQKASAGSSTLRMIQLIDADQFSRVATNGLPDDGRTAAIRRAFRQRFGGQMGIAVIQATGGWARHQLSKPDIADSLDLASVAVRVWTNDEYTVRVRCWLIRSSAGWKLYDFSEFGLGLRMSAAVRISISEAENGIRVPRASLNALLLAIHNVSSGEFEAASEQMELVDGIELPPFLDALRHACLAAIAIGFEDPEQALRELARTQELGYDLPSGGYMRAVALNQLYRHEEAFEAIVGYEKLVGVDAETLVERGIALAGLGKQAEAMAAFREGLKDTPGSTENLGELGLLLDEDDKGEIAEHFARFQRPAEQFEYVAFYYLDAEDAAALDVLTESLARVAPDDLNVACYRAEVAQLKGDFKLAAMELREVLPRITDEELRPYYLQTFLDASLEAGESVEAYSQVPEKVFAFKYLANDLSLDERNDELRALIAAHRKRHPEDPEHWMFEGFSHLDDERYEEADQAFSRALPLDTEGLNEEDIRYFRVVCWYEMGKSKEALRQLGPVGPTFDQLGDLLERDGRIDEIGQLIRQYEADHGKTSLSDYWRGQVHWMRGEHRQFVEKFLPQWQQIQDDHGASHGPKLRENLIRSLLRLDRAAEALPIARQLSADQDNPVFELLAYAALGQIDDAQSRLSSCLEDWYFAEELLADEDLNRALQREDAGSLRRNVIRAFVDEETSSSLILLLEAPVTLKLESVEDAVAAVWKTEAARKNVTPGEASDEDPNEYFSVTRDGISLTITSVHQPRCAYPETVALEIRELRTRKGYGQHRAFLRIDVESELKNDAAWQMAARLLVELGKGTQPLLVEAPGTGRLAVWNDDLKQGLLGERPLQAVQKTRMVPVILIEDDDPKMLAVIETARKRWPEFVSAFESRKEEQLFSVKAAFKDGDAEEAMWIRVASIRDGRVHGKLDSDPVDVSTVKQGDAVEVAAKDILDWLYTSADGKSITGLFSRAALNPDAE